MVSKRNLVVFSLILGWFTAFSVTRAVYGTGESDCCPGDMMYTDCSGCQADGSMWYDVGNNDYDLCVPGPPEAGFSCDDDLSSCYYLTAPIPFYASEDDCTNGISAGNQLADQGKSVSKCNTWLPENHTGNVDDTCD